MATTGIQLQGGSLNHGGFDRSQLRALAPIALFDIAGPLAVYWLLRAAGMTEVTALIISGILPAFGVALGIIRHRRIDAIGSLVLLGIVAGTAVGLLTHSARLILMEGSIPTAVFGLACLGSLLTARPLMYRISLQTRGADTAAGRQLQARLSQPVVRHAFRLVTLVWGVTLLAEAAARVVIVEAVPAGTALMIVRFMPYLVLAVLFRWMFAYTRRVRHEAGQRAAVLRAAGGEPAPALAQR
jgi:hypothetical protein